MNDTPDIIKGMAAPGILEKGEQLFARGAVLGIHPDKNGGIRFGIPLWYGAHIANDLTFPTANPPKKKPGRKIKNNAKFDGLFVKADGDIRPRTEIFVAYDLKDL